jgi:hypothetical protein
MGQQGGGFSKL